MNKLNSMLQLFADAAENTGVSAPDAGVQGVKQQAEAAALPQTEDPETEFERLIQGRFKDQYNARVQDILRKRLKSQDKTLEQNRSVETPPSGQTSVQAKDPQNLTQELDADQQRSRELNRQTSAKRQYEQWMWQAQQAQKTYPNLNLTQEIRNPRFRSLLNSGVDVADAYLLTHQKRLISAAMRSTAKDVEEKLANRIAANGARPSESAMTGRGTTVVADQVSHMSKAQRQDIIRRVQRGEIIRF